ncbi:MAG TPA: hypothetical protein PLG99_02240, partial [Kaistiaceae bacterium]|nr:hypothetical protein [Kaistiaceae bacterium]
MCDLSMALQFAGTGLKIAGGIGGGMASNASGKSSLRTALINASLMKERAALGRKQADYAYAKGNFEANRLKEQIDDRLSAGLMRTGTANPAGLSPLLMQMDAEAQGAVDLGLVRAGAGIEAAGYRMQAANTEANAASILADGLSARWRGSSDLMRSVVGAGSMLIGQVADLVPTEFGGAGKSRA